MDSDSSLFFEKLPDLSGFSPVFALMVGFFNLMVNAVRRFLLGCGLLLSRRTEVDPQFLFIHPKKY